MTATNTRRSIFAILGGAVLGILGFGAAKANNFSAWPGTENERPHIVNAPGATFRSTNSDGPYEGDPIVGRRIT